MLSYAEPDLPYTLRAQLRRVVEHARMCGYGLSGNLLLTGPDGGEVALAVVGGEWCELMEVTADGEP